jgi:hypothetical protein
MGTYRRCAVSFPWPRAEFTVSPLTTERFAQHPTEIAAVELRFHRVSATSDGVVACGDSDHGFCRFCRAQLSILPQESKTGLRTTRLNADFGDGQRTIPRNLSIHAG